MMKINGDTRRIILTACFYGAWFFGAYAFLSMCFSFFSDDPIYIWWALGNAIVTGLLIAVILIEMLYDVMDGDR